MSRRDGKSPLTAWRTEHKLSARDLAYAVLGGGDPRIANWASCVRLLEAGVAAKGADIADLWHALPQIAPRDVLKAHLRWIEQHEPDLAGVLAEGRTTR